MQMRALKDMLMRALTRLSNDLGPHTQIKNWYFTANLIRRTATLCVLSSHGLLLLMLLMWLGRTGVMLEESGGMHPQCSSLRPGQIENDFVAFLYEKK